jgi:hypothetical protein
VPFDFTISLGTALLIAVIALILLRGRFGHRPESPRKADPAERWLHAETTETPPSRDTPSRAQADDPGDPDGDGDAAP